VTVLAVGLGSAAAQRQNLGRAEEAFKTVIVNNGVPEFNGKRRCLRTLQGPS
jgi:hypothetical protein